MRVCLYKCALCVDVSVRGVCVCVDVSVLYVSMCVCVVCAWCVRVSLYKCALCVYVSVRVTLKGLGVLQQRSFESMRCDEARDNLHRLRTDPRLVTTRSTRIIRITQERTSIRATSYTLGYTSEGVNWF